MNTQTKLGASAVFAFSALLILLLRFDIPLSANFYVISFIFLFILSIGISITTDSYIIHLSIGFIVITSITLPTIFGHIHGYDTWFYVGGAESIIASGLEPQDQLRLLRPGIQIISAVQSIIFNIPVEDTGMIFLFVLRYSGLLVVYALTRFFSVPKNLSAIPILLLSSNYAYTAVFEFDHMAMGWFLFVTTVYAFMKIFDSKRSNRFISISFLGCLCIVITHAFTSFFIMVVVILLPLVYLARQKVIDLLNQSGPTLPGIRQSANPPLFVFGVSITVVLVAYTIWIGQASLISHIFAPLFGLKIPPPESPDPYLIKHLEYIQPPSTIKRFFSPQIALNWGTAILLPLLAGYLYIKNKRFRPATKQELFLYFSLTVVGVFSVARIISVSGIVFLVTHGRSLLFILPFSVGGVLTVFSIFDKRKTTAYAVFGVFLVIFVLFSTSLYPAVFFGHEPQPDDAFSHSLSMDSQDRSAYTWMTHGSRVIVNSKGSIYYRGMGLTDRVTPANNKYVYAGNRSRLREDSLMIVRPLFKRSLFQRSDTYHYRVPEEVYKSYDRRSNYHRVYSSSKHQVYFVEWSNKD